MRYSIGDVSRVLGMTTSALHFYEKEGIIDTPKVESGWRYYQEADISRLVSAKKYRAMGVPVRDIARQYAALVQDIDHLIAHGQEGLQHIDAVDIRRAEDMIYFRSSSAGRIPLDKGEQAVAKRWIEAAPAVSLSICRELTDEHAVPSLIISASRAADYGIEADGCVTRRIPGGMALHAVVACGEEQYDDPDVIFRPILAFAREHRFVQKGTMWGSMLFVDCSGGVRRHYFDTYMTFE